MATKADKPAVTRKPKALKPAPPPLSSPLKLSPNVPEYIVQNKDKVFIKYDAICIDMAPLGYVVAVFLWKGESVFTIGPFDLKPGTALNMSNMQGQAEVTLEK